MVWRTCTHRHSAASDSADRFRTTPRTGKVCAACAACCSSGTVRSHAAVSSCKSSFVLLAKSRPEPLTSRPDMMIYGAVRCVLLRRRGCNCSCAGKAAAVWMVCTQNRRAKCGACQAANSPLPIDRRSPLSPPTRRHKNGMCTRVDDGWVLRLCVCE